MSPSPDTMMDALTQLAALWAEYDSIAASYKAKMRHLDIALADATASLTFQIETLKAYLRPLLVTHGQTLKVNGVSAIVRHQHTWDTEGLRAFAQEVPSVLQFRHETTQVSFRHSHTTQHMDKRHVL